MLTLFFMLLCSHFVCDYPLQSEFIAVGKSPLKSPHCGVPWYYIMAGHAFTHGAGVFIVTGSVWLGIAETAVHFLIDWNKCLGRFGIHADQALHVACKVAWVALLAI